MGREIEVGKGVGGAHRSVASKVMQNTRDHRTLWIGVLYAIVIVMVLAVVAKLY